MEEKKYSRKANIILDAVFPRQCVCCDDIIDSGEELCDSCIRNIERIDLIKACTKCGLLRSECQCRIFAYHFIGCVAPFFNEGIARRGFYRFKLNRKEHYGIFYAREMAKSVVTQWGDIQFDKICYVPQTAVSFLKRGFNQSYILANGISEILEIPVVKDSLLSKSGIRSQHRLNKNQRLKMVQKKYRYNSKQSAELKDKTVLLVDDIKTTGATLDECARQLLFSGASAVYCVTALITDFSKEKKKAPKGFKNLIFKIADNIGLKIDEV